MLLLRCTKRLLARLPPAPKLTDPPPPSTTSTTTLGDFTAQLVTLARRPVVLAVSQRTLLPVLLPLAPSKTLVARFPEALRETLAALGIESAAIDGELAAIDPCIVTTTQDRRILGTINDFQRMLTCYPLPPGTLITHALDLARAPCSPIGMESPDRATRALFPHDGRPLLLSPRPAND